MAVAGAASVVGAITSSPTTRATLAAIPTGGLVPLGVLAAFSIGLPLLSPDCSPSGAYRGAARRWLDADPDLGGGRCAGAAALLAAGLVLT